MVELCIKLKPDSFPDVQHFITTSDNILWMKIFYPFILVKIKFIFLPHGQGLNQHCLNCSDVRRCSWFSGELAHVECLESIVRSSDLSTCVPKSPWAM